MSTSLKKIWGSVSFRDGNKKYPTTNWHWSTSSPCYILARSLRSSTHLRLPPLPLGGVVSDWAQGVTTRWKLLPELLPLVRGVSKQDRENQITNFKQWWLVSRRLSPESRWVQLIWWLKEERQVCKTKNGPNLWVPWSLNTTPVPRGKVRVGSKTRPNQPVSLLVCI